MRRQRQRTRRRGECCEACADRLNGQGVIFLDGTRRLYLCRRCCEDSWSRRDAADATQLAVLESLWQLAPWQTDGPDAGEAAW